MLFLVRPDDLGHDLPQLLRIFRGSPARPLVAHRPAIETMFVEAPRAPVAAQASFFKPQPRALPIRLSHCHPILVQLEDLELGNVVEEAKISPFALAFLAVETPGDGVLRLVLWSQGVGREIRTCCNA